MRVCNIIMKNIVDSSLDLLYFRSCVIPVLALYI